MRVFFLFVSVTFLLGHALAFLGGNPGIYHCRGRQSTVLSSHSVVGKIFQLEERQGGYICIRSTSVCVCAINVCNPSPSHLVMNTELTVRFQTHAYILHIYTSQQFLQTRTWPWRSSSWMAIVLYRWGTQTVLYQSKPQEGGFFMMTASLRWNSVAALRQVTTQATTHSSRLPSQVLVLLIHFPLPQTGSGAFIILYP